MRFLMCITFFIYSNVLLAKNNQLYDELDSLMSQYYELEQFNGVVMVAQNGEPLLNKGYGYANFEWQIKHHTNGKFRLASVSKQFTAMLILQLVEQGKLELNAKLTDYLPEYRFDTGSKISIRQLLTHTSGLANFFHHTEYQSIEARNPYNLTDFVAKFCSDDLHFEPGSAFRYSNAGYTILGAVIERVTSKTYAQVLSSQILQPAGMLNTGFNGQDTLLNQFVSGYERLLKGVKPAEYVDMSVPYSSGSIYSTAHDLLLWDRAIANNLLLSKIMTKELFKVTEHRNYAAGWEVNDLDKTQFNKQLTRHYHSGGIQGYGASIARIAEDNLVIVLLNNTGGAPFSGITENLLNVIYQQPIEKPKLGFTQRLYKKIEQEGVDKALNWYKKQSENGNDLSERRLNRFGYDLLQIGEANAAVAFFKHNTFVHKTSHNAYDSLADGYMAQGDYHKAYKSLLKANEFAPDKSFYQTKLAKLKLLAH